MLTAADLDGVVGPLEPSGPPTARDALVPVRWPTTRCACTGEPIAIVVAETRALAEDACELVEVDIEPLPAITTIDDALDPGGPVLFDELGTNVMFHRSDRYGDPDGAFARADRVVSARFAQQRMANVPLEGRARASPISGATRTSSSSTSRTRTPTRYAARSRRCSITRTTSSPCAAATSGARSARRRTPAARN